MRKIVLILILIFSIPFLYGKRIYEVSHCFSIDVPSNLKFEWRVNYAMTLWNKFTTAYLTFPNGDYVFISFPPPEVIPKTQKIRKNLVHVVANKILTALELKKYYKYRDLKNVRLPGNFKGLSELVIGKNDSLMDDFLLGRVFFFDMGDFIFFSYIYTNWKPGNVIVKHAKEIKRVLMSYEPHLERDNYLESVINGKWVGEVGSTADLQLNSGSTTIVKKLFYSFLNGNIVYTSGKGIISNYQSTGDSDVAALISGRSGVFKGKYYVYGGNHRDRGLLVILIPVNGKLIARSNYFMLDNNNRKMYLNYFVELFRVK